MKGQNLLLLNGSHSEIPLIRSAQSLGFRVITSGNNPGLPGHQYSDEYLECDYSDKEQVLELVAEKGIHCVVSCANDFGALTAAYVGEQLSLPGHDTYETTLILHHKDKFKRFSESINLKTASAISCHSVEDALNRAQSFRFPIMVKPVDLTGGKGITRVDSLSELEPAVKKAFSLSRQKTVVLEDFFAGTQHSLSTFLVNGRVHAFFSDNEYSLASPYLVSTSAAPATHIERHLEGLIRELEKVAEALSLVDGVLHCQYLANDQDFMIIEATRRCSGDLYPWPVQQALGVDWAEWIVRAETGMDCSTLPVVRQQGFVGRHCVIAERNGVVKDVIIAPELKPCIVDQVMWWKPGDVIADHLVEKLGVLVFSFPDRKTMEYCIDHILSLVQVVME